eukprot:134421_1
MYSYQSDDCYIGTGDDDIFSFISIKHGEWIPSDQYIKEALDFAWADFETEEEKDEIEGEQVLDESDETDDDKKKLKEIKEKIFQRQNERNKQKHGGPPPPQPATPKTGRRLLKKNKNKNNKNPHPPPPKSANFNKNKHFDPRHSLANPANILKPNTIGDEGEGDLSFEEMKHSKDPKGLPSRFGSNNFPGGHIPNFFDQHTNRHINPNDIMSKLRGRNKQKIKHMNQMRQ